MTFRLENPSMSCLVGRKRELLRFSSLKEGFMFLDGLDL